MEKQGKYEQGTENRNKLCFGILLEKKMKLF